MNNFTKEELEYLMRKFMLTKGDDFKHNLEHKLQSMIDNYCDHNFMTFLQDKNNEPFIDKCMSCHKWRFVNE